MTTAKKTRLAQWGRDVRRLAPISGPPTPLGMILVGLSRLSDELKQEILKRQAVKTKGA